MILTIKKCWIWNKEIHLRWWSLLMKRWGRFAWDGWVMFKWEQLMRQWEKMSWFKLRKWKKKKCRGRLKIKLIVVKNDMSIKEIIESMTRMVENDSCGQSLIRLLRIHSWPKVLGLGLGVFCCCNTVKFYQLLFWNFSFWSVFEKEYNI